MNQRKKYSKNHWQEIASYLSGESTNKNVAIDTFSDKSDKEIMKYFEMTDKERGLEKVDVDKAWGKVFNKLSEENLIETRRSLWAPIIRVAAALILLVTTTITVRYFIGDSGTPQLLSVATTLSEKNRIVNMPDGSTVTLNRNSRISFPNKFKGEYRSVELEGEAFFDIVPNARLPFVISAGSARVKVLGTSFNIISSNNDNEIEVFVKTGKVELSSASGSQKMTLEPGYIGKIGKDDPVLEQNSNQNYMSWNTEVLLYDGARLKQVFDDLLRVHNISVEVESDSILDLSIATEFSNNSAETIIKSICQSFNLNFEKKGEIYYLSD